MFHRFFELGNPKIGRNIFAAVPEGILALGPKSLRVLLFCNSKLLHLLLESKIVKSVDLDMSPFGSINITKNRNLEIKKDTLVALLVLLKADNSLLFLRERNKKEHFFVQSNDDISELINQKFLIEKNGKNYEYHNRQYQNQLEALFGNCAKNINLKNADYTTKDLVDKFIKYADCTGCDYSCYFKSKEDKNILSFGLSTGISFESKNLTHTDYFERINNIENQASPNIFFGINTSIASKRNFNKNSIFLELYYHNDKVSNQTKDYVANFSYLNLESIIRKQIGNIKQLKPYYGLGLGFKYLLSNQEKALYDMNKVRTFFVGEVGLKYKNFVFSSRFKSNFAEDKNLIYVYKKVAEVIDKITYKNILFQVNLTYLFYNKLKSF